ncbi:unnamed protein product [Adineta ricciae]|uniref:Cytochrome P450 n=1 Tax=Adineta ricciae TaxID=249248 RepID=A0A813SAY6_ADIRI|nr:unnamed protein product [Adineta ricciae]CAF1105431.1 unnamed protein product [Adineta ricciae]
MLLLLLLSSLLLLILIYIKIKYFTLRNDLPGLSPHLFFGNLIQVGLLFGTKAASEVYISLKEKFGDIYQYWIGFVRLIVVHDIDDVQYIFTHRSIYDQGQVFIEKFSVLIPESIICNIGAKFKRHGAITMPLFRRNKITANLNLIVDATDKILDRWRAKPSEFIHKDIVEQSQNLLLEIFGLIAFDYNLETIDEQHSDKANELTQALQDVMSIFRVIIYSPRLVSTTYMKWNSKYRRARQIVERYLSNMMEQELNENPQWREERKKTSLIASLVHSLQMDEKIEAQKQEEDKKGLSRSEVFDEMLLFLIAGYETTSTALSWCIYQLSKYPKIQEKLKIEIMSKTNGQYITLEHIDSLSYLDCFINEVFRYSPTIDGTSRAVMVDDRLPKTGVQLYKGDQILLPTSALSRDKRYWKIDPDLFYPERFLNEDKDHNPYAFSPFGGGHRQCLGQDLARFELKVIVARMLQQVTFVDGGQEVNSGGYVQKLTILPRHIGIVIQFN